MELPNRNTRDPYQEIPVKDFSYVNTKKRITKKDKKSQFTLIASCLLLLVILAGGAYLYGYYTRDNKKKETSLSSNSSVVVKNLSNNIYTPQTTSYNSTSFGFNINYPSSWQVSSESSANVEFTSPIVNLISDTGQSVKGRAVMSVVDQGQIPAAFGSSSVAVLDSVDLSFDSPTSDQAAESYISFIQYPATNVKGGLDGIYLTGNNGYLKDDVITSSIINQMSPLIYVTFLKCHNTSCTTSSPLTISSTMWNNSNFMNAITKTIQSITFS